VVANGNSSAGSFRSSDTPVLLESCSALNGGLVGSRGLVDFICTPINVDGTRWVVASRRLPGTVALDDVILNKWVNCPTVNRQI